MTDTALYLLDEDYAGWPLPVFGGTYDYLKGTPYKRVRHRSLRDVIGVVRAPGASLRAASAWTPAPLTPRQRRLPCVQRRLALGMRTQEVSDGRPSYFSLLFEDPTAPVTTYIFHAEVRADPASARYRAPGGGGH